RPLAYTLLGGVRVLEVALLAPDLLGMHLADLGAEVVKIEQPPGGACLREIGGRKRAGLNLMHLRWNRGKKSVTLDLRRREGQRLLHRLAARADVFVDGLRPGAAARCAADYATLAAVNPRLVYCTLSGAGTWGPYAALPTHGVAYDAFAGLAPPATHPDGSPRIPAYTAVGMFAAPLYAAFAVCAALVQARATGTGRLLEVAALFPARPRAEWVDFFIVHDVPGGPVHTADELPGDPHFRARELLYEQDHPVAGHLRLFGTPVKVAGEAFAAAPAPAPGEHT